MGGTARLLLGGVGLDLGQGLVHVAHGTVRLRRLERDALGYLVRHLERVVTVEELLERVWSYHPAARTRTVHATMVQLRAKLDGLGGSGFTLQTYHGYGFRLSPCASPALAPTVGRDDLLAATTDWLSGQRGRLLTLTGEEGSGRTHLARALCGRAGIATVIRDPDPAAVLATLEHAPALVVLAVCRAPLGLQAEAVVAVARLDPDAAGALFARWAPGCDPSPWTTLCDGNALALRLAAGLAAGGVSPPSSPDLLVDLAIDALPADQRQRLSEHVRGGRRLEDPGALDAAGVLHHGPCGPVAHPVVARRLA